MPALIAAEVHGYQAGISEKSIDALAISHRSGRGVAILPVNSLHLLRFGPGGFPQQLAILAVETQHGAPRAVVGSGEKNPVLPNNWRRVPASWYFHLPAYVFHTGPGIGIALTFHNPLGGWTPPLGPVLSSFPLRLDH